MENEKKRKTIIPKDFFTKIRPTISTKDALKDVIPVEWKVKDNSRKEKVIVYSAKGKKVL